MKHKYKRDAKVPNITVEVIGKDILTRNFAVALISDLPLGAVKSLLGITVLDPKNLSDGSTLSHLFRAKLLELRQEEVIQISSTTFVEMEDTGEEGVQKKSQGDIER